LKKKKNGGHTKLERRGMMVPATMEIAIRRMVTPEGGPANRGHRYFFNETGKERERKNQKKHGWPKNGGEREGHSSIGGSILANNQGLGETQM